MKMSYQPRLPLSSLYRHRSASHPFGGNLSMEMNYAAGFITTVPVLDEETLLNALRESQESLTPSQGAGNSPSHREASAYHDAESMLAAAEPPAAPRIKQRLMHLVNECEADDDARTDRSVSRTAADLFSAIVALDTAPAATAEEEQRMKAANKAEWEMFHADKAESALQRCLEYDADAEYLECGCCRIPDAEYLIKQNALDAAAAEAANIVDRARARARALLGSAGNWRLTLSPWIVKLESCAFSRHIRGPPLQGKL
jgi:hypothetical protein